jgi:dTDP-4-dehydrorhamnose 3,5-epimerase
MKFKELHLMGCYQIIAEPFHDQRGSFTKIYHQEMFDLIGLDLDIAEQYYTVSNKGILRGMHFQVPPHDHTKLVTCLSGRVLDIILDLRSTSPTFGQFDSLILDSKAGNALYLPCGIAHGFLSLEDNSGLYYSTTTTHHPECDEGIRWNSFGFDWPINSPIISDRDYNLTTFEQFKTPF